MSDDHLSKTEVLEFFDTAWDDLQRVIANADPGAMMTKTDAAGWNVRDHLAHLAVWANGVLGMLRDGRPQWEGLGIPRERFDLADVDRMNEEIRQNTLDWPLDRTLARLEEVHRELMEAVRARTDDELQQPCSSFVEGGQDFEIIHKIDGNGPFHYDEHRPWIEEILAG